MTTHFSNELEQFLTVTQSEIDHALRALIAPHEELIPNLDDGLAYALGLDSQNARTGKRLRPSLCLLVCHDLSGRTRPALPFAAAIELMHNFCLVHDDIEDGDEFRRSRPAVWKRFGLPHAINIGDYLFTKIFAALLSGLGEVSHEKLIRFFALMGATLDHTHRGQALDMNARQCCISVDEYMKLVAEKTGYYLAAPLVAGAIAADASQDIEEALNSYGMLIGPMFQIRDDLIDLTHGKGRDAAGSDIREGKRSFMVAFSCEKTDKPTRERLIAILDKPREATDATDIADAIRLFEAIGAMAEAQRLCQVLKAKALRALDGVPEPLRGHLHEITEHLAERTT